MRIHFTQTRPSKQIPRDTAGFGLRRVFRNISVMKLIHLLSLVTEADVGKNSQLHSEVDLFAPPYYILMQIMIACTVIPYVHLAHAGSKNIVRLT